MHAIKGIYENGRVSLQEDFPIKGPVPVIIMFPEGSEARSRPSVDLNRFSFRKAQALLEELEEPLSTTVIEERRSEQ
jgi:hypothetical protein